MAEGPPRSVFVILCVFAVVLGATLFPASGFGANPVPAQDGGTGPAPDGGESTRSGTDGNETTTDTNDTTKNATATSSRTSTRPTTTTTMQSADETTTPTTTTVSGAYESSSDGGLLGALLSFVVMTGVVLVGMVAFAFGLGRHHRRRYPEQWDLPDAPHLRLIAYVRRVPQTSLSFVMFAGQHAPDILDSFGSGVGSLTSGLGGLASGFRQLGSGFGTAVVAIPTGVVRGIGGLARGIGSVSVDLSALFSGIGTGTILGRSSTGRPGADPRGGGRRTGESDEPPEPSPPSSVSEAWSRLQEDLGIAGSDGKTPRQIARRAVSRGVPRDAIESLTAVFQDVRYGGRPDDGERVESARAAYRRIKSALERETS